MSATIPRSVRVESQRADPTTTFNAGQKKAIRTAINYCATVDPTLADYQRLLKKIEQDMVLGKKERRQLQKVLSKHSNQRLSSDERRLNGWACSALWDAHRPSGDA